MTISTRRVAGILLADRWDEWYARLTPIQQAEANFARFDVEQTLAAMHDYAANVAVEVEDVALRIGPVAVWNSTSNLSRFDRWVSMLAMRGRLTDRSLLRVIADVHE